LGVGVGVFEKGVIPEEMELETKKYEAHEILIESLMRDENVNGELVLCIWC
jgi:hypothetical protein